MGIRRKRKDEYHHGDLRRALLDGALALIDEDGLGAVSTRALARRLGVSHAAPAHHFKDREALLAEVATEGFGHFTAALEEVSQRCEKQAASVTWSAKPFKNCPAPGTIKEGSTPKAGWIEEYGVGFELAMRNVCKWRKGFRQPARCSERAAQSCRCRAQMIETRSASCP